VTEPRKGSVAAAVAGVQKHLEAIYAVEAGHDIHRFLVGDAQVNSLVEAGVLNDGHRGADEQVLLIGSEGGGVELALHLADRVQAGIEGSPSLQDHCHLTEGVSHVLLLLYADQQQRTLRLLDLELQAEVDKAATCLLIARCTPGSAPSDVWLRRLFSGMQLRADLSRIERARYREAHRLGARYARYLAELLGDGVERLLDELRRFYRLPAEGKRERARAA